MQQLDVVVDQGETSFRFTESYSMRLSSQWRFQAASGGYYHIGNQSLVADTVLGVVDDGVFNQLSMQPLTDTAGQRWILERVDDDYCRFYTEQLGPAIALSVAPSEATNLLDMQTVDPAAATQNWNLVRLGMNAAPCN